MKITKLLIGSLLISSYGMVFGGILQLDFGTGGVYSGTEAPAKVSDKVWNEIAGDVTRNLVFADGLAANDVAVDLGSGVPGAEGFWNKAPRAWSVEAFDDIGGEHILKTDLGKSWIYTKGETLGARVKGLEKGVYDVYVIVREPNAPERTYDVGVGVGDISDINDLNIASIGVTTDGLSFIKGESYVLQRVTLSGKEDFITVIVDPTNDKFGTMQGIQIVPVP